MKNTNLTECSAAMRESRIHLNQRPGNKPVISRIITLILAGLILPIGSLTFSGCGKKEQADKGVKEAVAEEMAKPIQHRRMMPDDMTLAEIIQQLKKYAKVGNVKVQDGSIYGQDPSYYIFRDDEELLMHYDLLCDGLETINDYSYLRRIVNAAQRGPSFLPKERYIKSLIHLGAYHSLNAGGNSYKWETKTVKKILDDYKKRPDLYPKDFINIFFSDIGNSDYDDKEGSEKIKLLLEHGADVNAKDNHGSTALMRAASGGREKTAKLLLEHGADVNAKDNDGMTALMKAAKYWESTNEGVVRLLLEHGADVNAKDNDGMTALMKAAECWESTNEGVVRLLLEHGADVNARDNNGRTPLMFAGSEEEARLLLQHGADVNARDNNGRTPLMFAGSEEEARLLLQHGADVNAKDNSGKTALMIAREGGMHWGLEQLLREHGADDRTEE